jgi:PAS domain S-box-containing protein
MKFNNSLLLLRRWQIFLTLVIFVSITGILLSLIGYPKIFGIIGVIICLLSIGGILLIQFLWLIKPVNSLTRQLEMLAQGKTIEITGQKNSLKAFRFANGISTRYYHFEKQLSGILNKNHDSFNHDNNTDIFDQSIQRVNQYLTQLKTEEADWKAKESLRAWTNQGIARFSVLLRQHTSSLEELLQRLLADLIKYLNYNQGGIFLVRNIDSTDAYLEMIAAYAYDRQKYPDKRCSMEDGFLGAACYEKQSIYLTDIPANYITIRSGMGEALPRSLFIVPLLSDEKVLGVIELAAFTEMAPHEREFIEKVAESIASTLSASYLNETTVKLLQQSQKQSEELAQQEEELRQNIEELKAHQDEMTMKQLAMEESEKLMRKIIDLVPFPIFVKNIHSQYIVANQEEGKLFNLPVDHLIGKADDDLINDVEELNAIHESDRKVLKENQMIKLPEQTISLPDGTKRVLQTIKVPFVNNVTKNRNILGVSIDLTAIREMEDKLRESNEKARLLAQKLELADKQ